MNSWLFLSLLIAHIIADFYLQTNNKCKDKELKKIKSCFLYKHSLIVGVVSMAVVWDWGFWKGAVIIMFTHFLIDLLKLYMGKGICQFVIDQLFHIVVIYFVSISSFVNFDILPIQLLSLSKTISIPVLLLIVLLIGKPTNVVIKLILENYDIVKDDIAEMKNAGALIGILERMLTVLFVFIGQYGAIGFIVAAKSILRFRDNETAKTEYVLAGTFLSFGIALVCGIILKELS